LEQRAKISDVHGHEGAPLGRGIRKLLGITAPGVSGLAGRDDIDAGRAQAFRDRSESCSSR
jgi:hypothetical protein